jgi:ABC-type Zn uptake system ZnuABC Zn-binding protein ZnuA
VPTSRNCRPARLLVAAAAVTVALAAGACGSDDAASADSETLNVVATTTQGADFARVIGGEHAEVAQILQPGVDPHDYEPSPADIVAIGEADVLVANGVGLEAWLDDAVEASGFDGTRVVMADGVTIHEGGEHAEDEAAHEDDAEEHADGDPHIWQDPANAKIMVADVAAGFSDTDPDDASYFQDNLEAYTAELDALDTYNTEQISTIPEANRKLVTNHDAFGYYTEAYGITYVGSIIPSFDTSAELSGEDIDAIVAAIKAEGVKAVFSESSLPPRTAETIGQEAGVTVVAGEGALYADTLGPAGSDGGTYLDAARHNTDTIVAALR